ncbi:Ribosomal RNA large subunit methyltransferase A [Lactococcus fujiensis JCM 16395]|uniref:Ribosomal RNA large subunit methyltransferase A n=2 Tax=Lactococcus fujiensis TaxID=610251 RepID=A0A2A5RN18_9LACT|nr:methyltransferase domain-containing protein [Lactococcus fujiensis]PCS00727.1 Ribosomal RNA large subunit methyltransferase A [Lactococcus fujiensis JCM 16395]
MFEPRRRLISSGMYASVLSEIEKEIVKGNLLDVGTGEGTFLDLIPFSGNKFGFDIAKDGIEMATELEIQGFLSLSDLTNLPFADQTFSTILNIFTPSNYHEFKRVMTDDGVVLKIVPDQFYLRELRESYGIPLDYDNHAVVERFKEEFPKRIQKEIRSVFEIPEALRQDFLEMSPLEWAVSSEVKALAHQNPPKTATVHVQLLIGRK